MSFLYFGNLTAEVGKRSPLQKQCVFQQSHCQKRREQNKNSVECGITEIVETRGEKKNSDYINTSVEVGEMRENNFFCILAISLLKQEREAHCKNSVYFSNPIAKIGESRKKIVCNVVLSKLVRLWERKKIRTISIQVLNQER